MSDKPHIFPQGSNKWKTRPRPPGQRMHTLSIYLHSTSQTLTTELVKVPLVYLLCPPFSAFSSKYLAPSGWGVCETKIAVIVNQDSHPAVSGDLIAFLQLGRESPRYFQHHQTALFIWNTATNHGLATSKVFWSVSLIGFVQGD